MLGVLALAGAMYMGAGLFTGGEEAWSSFTVTEEAVSFTAHAEGLVLREERALCSGAQYLLVTAAEGARLPGGAAAAFEFGGAEDYAEALAAAAGEPADSAEQAVLALAGAKYGAHGRAGAAAEQLSSVLGLDAAYTDSPGAAAPAGGAALRVDEPGLFSSFADGFTGLTPGECAEPGALAAMLGAEPDPPEGAFGSLVTGVRWYFAALLGEEAAAGLGPGAAAELSFPEGDFTARVESVSEPEGGRCAVLFSCAEGLAGMLGARKTEAEMLVTRAEGLYVPAEAVYERGGRYFVRALVLGEAVETGIEPLCGYGGGYLVESGALHAGSEVLLPGA